MRTRRSGNFPPPRALSGRSSPSLRSLVVTVIAALGLLVGVLPAAAEHTDNTREGVDFVGFHELHGTGFNTDVWPHVTNDNRLFAYLGSYGTGAECPSEEDDPDDPQESGIKVVDVTDPENPEMLMALADPQGGKTNDVKVETSIETEDFAGDILAGSIEPCGFNIDVSIVDGVQEVPREQTGFRLYDVTDPEEPEELGSYHNGGLGVHNLYMFTRPDLGRAFVGNVHNEFPLVEEGLAGENDFQAEFQIVDISDPNNPELVATWELADAENQGGPAEEDLCHRRGDSSSCNLHDVWISDDGTLAYLSWWDAGLIMLDISDPEDPQYIGQAQNQLESSEDGTPNLEEEGNTHAVVPIEIDGRHIVVTGDEDFIGPGPQPHTVVDVAPEGAEVDEGEQMRGIEFDATRPLSDGAVGPLPALPPDDDSGCSYNQARTAAESAGYETFIAVARRGAPCATFQQKVTTAEQYGASGIVVANNNEGEGPEAGAAAGDIPGMMIGTEDGDRLMGSLSFTNPDAVQVTLDLVPPPAEEINPWGFSRILDITGDDDANWQEIDRFKAPHVDTLDQGPEPEESTFTAHNPVVGDDGRVYLSWYTNGLRVLEPDPEGTPGELNEVAWFVPRPGDVDSPEGDPQGRFGDHVGFWGSLPVTHPETGELLVLNADINRGLYVLRPPQDDAPASACPETGMPASGFGDTEGNTHERAIECVAWYGITLGAGTEGPDGRPQYAPAESTSRAQMASFIVRAAVEAGIELPAEPEDRFEDDDGSTHEYNINALAELGVVEGKSDTVYDPHSDVTRAQMASFIARLYELAVGELPEPSQNYFPDDDGNEHEDNINALAELGIVEGRDVDGERRYLPDQPVQRDQMASFLARTLERFVAAGVAFPGGADVSLETTEVAAGGDVPGSIVTNKQVGSLTADGCGLDAQEVAVEDGSFAVTIPEGQEPGECRLTLTVATQREATDPVEQRATFGFDLTVTE